MKRDWDHIDSRWLFKQSLPNDAWFHRIYTYDDIVGLRSVIQQIKEKNSLFLAAYEGYPSVIDALYKNFICPFDFDESKITFVSAAFNVQELINEFATKYNRKPIKGVYFPFFEWLWDDQFFNIVRDGENSLENFYEIRRNSNMIKTYTNLNRRWALHRSTCVGLLHHYNLMDKGFVTFNVSHPIQALKQNKTKFNKNIFKILNINDFTSINDPNNAKKIWKSSLPYILFQYRNNKEIYDIFKNNKTICDIPEMTIPSPKLFETVHFYGVDSQLDYLHTYSLVSLISETTYASEYKSPFETHHPYELTNENSIVYTEKVFRPMTYRQPFIALSCPGYLRGLRQLGYKTFSPFIDESYDDIIDDGQRMLMALEEVKKLTLLDQTEQKKFLDNVDEVCQHNLIHLKSRFQTFLQTL